MKKGIAILIAVLAVIGIIIGTIAGSYNGLVNQQEEVENKHSVISVQLQRRADLIPNFVNTVKGYSDYEQKTYTAVTEARNAVKPVVVQVKEGDIIAEYTKDILPLVQEKIIEYRKRNCHIILKNFLMIKYLWDIVYKLFRCCYIRMFDYRMLFFQICILVLHQDIFLCQAFQQTLKEVSPKS